MKDVCGLDMHKGSVFMCILKKNDGKIEEKFGVLTPKFGRFHDLLISYSVEVIVMEGANIYRIPIWPSYVMIPM